MLLRVKAWRWLVVVLLGITLGGVSTPFQGAMRTTLASQAARSVDSTATSRLDVEDESAGLSLRDKLLKDVAVSEGSFNPTLGQEVRVDFELTRAATVEVQVYDADWGLVDRLGDKSPMSSGRQSLGWDGRDLDGEIVPDEAYFFVVVAEREEGEFEIYDPTTFSGGLSRDITDVDIQPESGTLHYNLPEAGRVLIRIGTNSGPMLNTLVDWKPRIKGAITEYWDGKDVDDVVDLVEHPKFRMLVTYFTLPENSVLTYGNRSVTYRDYKTKRAASRAVKEDRGGQDAAVSPHYRQSRVTDRAPGVTMKFIDAAKGSDGKLPVLKKRALVRVSLDDADKAHFQNSQFEVVFFLDLKFIAEDEAGYTPFNWSWDLSGVEPGEHLLTVNISGFEDQVGVKTRRVLVVE